MFCRVCPAFASADVLKVKKLWESVADGSMERRMDIAWLSVMWLRRVCRCIALWWTFHIVFKRHGHMYHCNPLWYGRQGSRDLWRYLFNIVGTCWHLSKCPSLSHALAFWPTVGCCGGLLALDGPAPWLHAVNRTLEMTIQDMNRNIIMKHLPSCTKQKPTSLDV